MSSPQPSLKHTTYFQVYDYLFEKYRGREITFVEIGVLGGGSLFMWRDFFGSRARIIGIDLNPAARVWKEHGFEILIGDQSDPAFWQKISSEVGQIDVLLDDGGHTYLQQATVANEATKLIVDGGLLVIEDTHTSYMKGFGPRKYSFMKFTHALLDQINQRFHRFAGAKTPKESSQVWSVQVFESIVAFHIDRRKSNITSNEAFNRPAEDRRKLPSDFRNHKTSSLFVKNPNSRLASRLASFLALVRVELKVRDRRELRQIFKGFRRLQIDERVVD
jgi:hypothetical protein